MPVEPVSDATTGERFQSGEMQQTAHEGAGRSTTASQLPKSPDSLEAALHAWSIQQALNDFNAGFPLLLSIPNSEAKCYLRHVGELSPELKPQFVAALAQCARIGDPELFTEEVTATILFFLKKKARLRLARANQVPTDSLTRFRHIYEQLQILGKCERRRDGWEFRTPSNGYRIATVVQIEPALKYWHHVYNPFGDCVLQDISYLQWYGISRTTVWDYMTGDPDERSLKLLRDVCVRFVAGFADILALTAVKAE